MATLESMQQQNAELRQQLREAADAMAAMNQRLQALESTSSAASSSNISQLLQRMADNQTRIISQMAVQQDRQFQQFQEHQGELLRQLMTNKKQLVDSKGIGKPSVFKSEPGKFNSWSFKFQNFVNSIFNGAHEAFLWAENHEDIPITQEELRHEFLEPVSGEAIPEILEMDKQVYAAISQLMEGEAEDIVRNTEPKSGLEAWRKLIKKYDPMASGRRRNLMNQILQPPKCKIQELQSGLEKWETLIRVYERRRGADGQTGKIPEDIKIGVITEMCPDVLKTHLQLNQDKFRDYSDVRMQIMNYLEVKVNSDGPVPMDIGSFQQHPYKGKDKGRGKGKGKGGDRWCDHCRTTTHSSSQCWYKGKGAPEDKGKGKAKGKYHYQDNIKGKGQGSYQSHSAHHHYPSSKGKVDPKGKSKGKGKWKGKGFAESSLEEDAQGQEQEPWTENWNANGENEGDPNAQEEYFSLFSDAQMMPVCYDSQESDNSLESKQSLREVEMIVDSGASRSTIPKEIAEKYGIIKDIYTGRQFICANGGKLTDYGHCKIKVVDEFGNRKQTTWRVTDAKFPLLAMSQITDHNHRVVLDGNRGIIRNKKSWSETPVFVKNGQLRIRLWLIPPIKNSVYEKKEDLSSLSWKSEDNHSVFRVGRVRFL